MISHHRMMEVLLRVTNERNEMLLMSQLSGILAGISIAMKDPKLAREIDEGMRQEWMNDHRTTAQEDPGMPYGPGSQAEIFMNAFNPDPGVTL